jgi:hypothetical protein
LIIAALLFSATITSCKIGGSVKLLDGTAYEDGKLHRKFEYDGQNRITQILDYCYDDNGKVSTTDTIAITYNADGSVTIKNVYGSDGSGSTKLITVSGNKVSVENDSFTINEDGFIVKSGGGDEEYGWTNTYEYKDGNLIGEEGKSNDGRESERNYSYDDKNSPFSQSNTAKWLIQYLLGYEYASKNNVVDFGFSGSEQSGAIDHVYKYDKDEFPIIDTATSYCEGEEDTSITRFIYRKKASGNPAKVKGKKLLERILGENKNISFKTETSVDKTDTDDNSDNGETSDNGAALQFTYEVEFNNKKIEMTVFYSELSDNDFFANKIDSLIFTHNGQKQSVAINMESEVFNGDEVNWGLISVNDCNFDGYMDIAVLNNRSVSNSVYNYFIYNPNNKSYEQSEALSGLMNASFDDATKTIRVYNVSGAGKYFTSETYKWDGAKLLPIQNIHHEPNENGVVVRVTRTLQNGKWIENTDTVEFEE